MPGGRPSKYKPKFCKVVEEVGAQGGWVSEMAEACDVHRSTFDEWCKHHPEFSAALMRAKQKAQAWFEAEGRKGLKEDRFNSSLWAKQMSARHRAEYSEKSQVDHISSDGSLSPPTRIVIEAAQTNNQNEDK